MHRCVPALIDMCSHCEITGDGKCKLCEYATTFFKKEVYIGKLT